MQNANGTSSNGFDYRKNGNGSRKATKAKVESGESAAARAAKQLPLHYTDLAQPTVQIYNSDARKLPLENNTVDLIVTSPPYWRKRDYGVPNQIGQEETVKEYIANIIDALKEWRRVLRPTGSVFLNIGDSYFERSLVGVPIQLETAAVENKWLLRNRIMWTKESGMPDPAKNRLTNRYEFILHLAPNNDYYYDLFGYSEIYGNGANPGDVWNVNLKRSTSEHLAPFPDEIVERAVTLACPQSVCARCGTPRNRIVQRTMELDANRPQAKRAMEIAEEAGLTPEHIAAVQATGVSDAGKALRVQNGTGRNAAKVKELAAEAKKILGGYFREFTFAKKETAGWSACSCASGFIPGVVLDPFMGTGTTVKVAERLGRSAIGSDLNPMF